MDLCFVSLPLHYLRGLDHVAMVGQHSRLYKERRKEKRNNNGARSPGRAWRVNFHSFFSLSIYSFVICLQYECGCPVEVACVTSQHSSRRRCSNTLQISASLSRMYVCACACTAFCYIRIAEIEPFEMNSMPPDGRLTGWFKGVCEVGGFKT